MKYVDYYGIDAILQPFVASVQELQKGVVIEVDSNQKTLLSHWLLCLQTI